MRKLRATLDPIATAADPADSLKPAAPPASPREARDARVFAPTTFASRRAERGDAPPRPKRLVSLGRQVHRIPGAGTTGRARVQEFESFADLDDAHTMYARLPGSSELQPIALRASQPDTVTLLDPLPARPRFTSGTFPTGESERIDQGEALPW